MKNYYIWLIIPCSQLIRVYI